MNNIKRMLEDRDAEILFTTKEGRNFLLGAVNQFRNSATLGAGAVRLPELRDKIPPHVRVDILRQSRELFEFVGRLELALIFIDELPDEIKERCRAAFAALYTSASEQEDSLRKLCKLTVETYAPQAASRSRAVDRDF